MVMFYTNIGIAEKYNYLEDKFKKGYQWLKETDILSLPEGSYLISGEEVVANIQEYTTVSAQQCLFETHEKYFDIQYVASGREQFGICSREGLVVKERIEEKDLIFYEEPLHSGSVFLKEGDMIVVAPEDAHKPRLLAGEPCKVKKVVIKVAL
jgi:YhcH/YjgK/YiaL family protein